jgi:hypothetical protein
MLLLLRTVLLAGLKGMGALLLGGTLLWRISQCCGTQQCEVVVHVMEDQVDVWIDESSYYVENVWDTPIVCKLAPGNHRLRLFRGERILNEQEFILEPGQDAILSAFDEQRLKRARAGLGTNSTGNQSLKWTGRPTAFPHEVSHGAAGFRPERNTN